MKARLVKEDRLTLSPSGWDTYRCSHVQITRVTAQSPAHTTQGHPLGTQVELCGVVEMVRERWTGEGTRVWTERPPGTVWIHVPTDGPVVYLMDDRGETTHVVRAPEDETGSPPDLTPIEGESEAV